MTFTHLTANQATSREFLDTRLAAYDDALNALVLGAFLPSRVLFLAPSWPVGSDPTVYFTTPQAAMLQAATLNPTQTNGVALVCFPGQYSGNVTALTNVWIFGVTQRGVMFTGNWSWLYGQGVNALAGRGHRGGQHRVRGLGRWTSLSVHGEQRHEHIHRIRWTQSDHGPGHHGRELRRRPTVWTRDPDDVLGDRPIPDDVPARH